MHVLALPGRRIETEAWMKAVLAAAGLTASNMARYRHWATSVDASVAYEAQCLEDQAPDLVVAKSLGTVIAARAFCQNGFRPAAAVLIGTPYAALEGEDFQCLKQFAAGVETLYIQQLDDPGGSAQGLRAALDVPVGKVTAVPGDDHIYSDTASLGSIIEQWRKRLPSA